MSNKNFSLPLLLLVAVLFVSSCRSLTYKLRKQEQESQRLGLNFVQEDKTKRMLDSLYQFDASRPIVVQDDDGNDVTLVQVEKDENTGEVLPTTTLKEVTVYQTLKNIVERGGKVNLDFIITVPKSLIDDRWQLRVSPRAFKDNEEQIDLEPLVLSGAHFLRQQEKGYQQYKAFLASIVPDSLYWQEMIDHKGIAKALNDLEIEYHNAWQRELFGQQKWIDWRDKMNQRYMLFNRKMERNRSTIDPETSLLAVLPAYWLERGHTNQSVPNSFAEYAWGNKGVVKREITAEDSLEIERKYTNIKRIAENERKKQEKEAMYNKMVKFPRVAARLDSIVSGDNDFKYYYSQELDADSGTRRIKLVLDGEVVAVDMSTYNVPPSDTLTYFVSAMVDLLDEAPRYKKEIIYRQVDREVAARIEFKSASSRVDPTLGNNEAELLKIKDIIFDIEDGGAFILDSLTMTGYASPEGRASYNRDLANRRTQALRDYLVQNDYFEGRRLPVRAANGGENWIGITVWANDTTQHDFSPIQIAELLTIINSEHDEDRRETTIRREMPQLYEHLRENVYPSLRQTIFRFYTHRAEMEEDWIETTVIDEYYNEGRELLRDRNYKEALQILSNYPDDYNYAIALMSLGYDTRALGILENLPNCDEDADILYLRAILYVRVGEIAKGLNALNKSASLDTRKIFRAQMDPELNLLIETYNLFDDYLNF